MIRCYFRSLILILVTNFLFGCKTTARQASSKPASVRSSNRFECLDKLRTFSQGQATALTWPEETPAAPQASVTFAVIVTPKANDSTPEFHLEDAQGLVYNIVPENSSSGLNCPGIDDMYCLQFTLPHTDHVQYAARLQVFENESIVNLHTAILGDANGEFAAYPKATLTPNQNLKNLVVQDIRDRLKTVPETLKILTLNQDSNYAESLEGEANSVVTNCAAFSH